MPQKQLPLPSQKSQNKAKPKNSPTTAKPGATPTLLSPMPISGTADSPLVQPLSLTQRLPEAPFVKGSQPHSTPFGEIAPPDGHLQRKSVGDSLSTEGSSRGMIPTMFQTQQIGRSVEKKLQVQRQPSTTPFGQVGRPKALEQGGSPVVQRHVKIYLDNQYREVTKKKQERRLERANGRYRDVILRTGETFADQRFGEKIWKQIKNRPALKKRKSVFLEVFKNLVQEIVNGNEQVTYTEFVQAIHDDMVMHIPVQVDLNIEPNLNPPNVTVGRKGKPITYFAPLRNEDPNFSVAFKQHENGGDTQEIESVSFANTDNKLIEPAYPFVYSPAERSALINKNVTFEFEKEYNYGASQYYVKKAQYEGNKDGADAWDEKLADYYYTIGLIYGEFYHYLWNVKNPDFGRVEVHEVREKIVKLKADLASAHNLVIPSMIRYWKANEKRIYKALVTHLGRLDSAYKNFVTEGENYFINQSHFLNDYYEFRSGVCFALGARWLGQKVAENDESAKPVPSEFLAESFPRSVSRFRAYNMFRGGFSPKSRKLRESDMPNSIYTANKQWTYPRYENEIPKEAMSQSWIAFKKEIANKNTGKKLDWSGFRDELRQRYENHLGVSRPAVTENDLPQSQQNLLASLHGEARADKLRKYLNWRSYNLLQGSTPFIAFDGDQVDWTPEVMEKPSIFDYRVSELVGNLEDGQGLMLGIYFQMPSGKSAGHQLAVFRRANREFVYFDPNVGEAFATSRNQVINEIDVKYFRKNKFTKLDYSYVSPKKQNNDSVTT